MSALSSQEAELLRHFRKIRREQRGYICAAVVALALDAYNKDRMARPPLRLVQGSMPKSRRPKRTAGPVTAMLAVVHSN